MAKLVSRADLARAGRVTKAAITKLIASGKIADAIVADRIDLDHPAVRAWLAARGVTGSELDRAPTDKPKAGKKKTPDPTPPAKPERKVTHVPPQPPTKPPPKRRAAERQIPLPESLEELGDLADHLRPLIERYGTSRTFTDWLNSLKTIEEIQAKNLTNQQTEGKLISRELVEAHVFGAIDALGRVLLRDAPKTVARKIVQGASLEERERIVEGVIGQAFKTMKAQVEKALANA